MLTNKQTILFLHISKTAGSSIKLALKEAFFDHSFSNVIFEHELKNELKQKKYDFYVAHVGYHMAKQLESEVITVLREPIDRINSLYNFWHTRIPKVDPGGVFELVNKMNPKDFFRSNDIKILVGRQNTQAYQLAYSHSKYGREKLKTLSNEEILSLALENLSKCKVVGFVEHMDNFIYKVEKVYGKKLNIPKINISKKNHNNFVFDSEIRSIMFESIYLDIMLYNQALKLYL